MKIGSVSRTRCEFFMNYQLIEHELFRELKASTVCIVEQLDCEKFGLLDLGFRANLEFNGHGSLLEYRDYLSRLYELFKIDLYAIEVTDNPNVQATLSDLRLKLKELRSGLQQKNLEDSFAGVEVSWPIELNQEIELSAIEKKTLKFLKEQSNCLLKLSKCINHFIKMIDPETLVHKNIRDVKSQYVMALGRGRLIDHDLKKYQLVELLAALHATGKIKGDRIDFFRAMEPVFGKSFEDSAKVVGKIKDRKGNRMSLLDEMRRCFAVVLEKEYR